MLSTAFREERIWLWDKSEPLQGLMEMRGGAGLEECSLLECTGRWNSMLLHPVDLSEMEYKIHHR